MSAGPRFMLIFNNEFTFNLFLCGYLATEMPNHNALSDKQLLHLLKSNDETAFTEIFDRYWSVLFIQACKLVRDEDDAADLVQEVFVKIWDHRETIIIQGGLLPYLARAVRYRFFDFLDRKKVRQDYADSLRIFMQEGRAITDEQLREKELLRTIDELVSTLPPKQKQIYEMSRKDSMSTAEIALALNVSEKTVQNQVSLALRELKLKLNMLQISGALFGSELISEVLKKI
ncbi:RNA polymerase sigma-70 factor [Mucilaginibacter defluvii]|uniref:RNA polymerase sigma-70 factor n=1 Tax=Mucilaginibacter defluvii TaxID=1196019 RepID=A0ABP9FVM9_9SPHI